jgi:hypothetical protein
MVTLLLVDSIGSAVPIQHHNTPDNTNTIESGFFQQFPSRLDSERQVDGPSLSHPVTTSTRKKRSPSPALPAPDAWIRGHFLGGAQCLLPGVGFAVFRTVPLKKRQFYGLPRLST